MNGNTYSLNKLRHTELLREADNERLVKLTTQREARVTTLSSRLLSPLGHALVQTGTYLLEHTKTELHADSEPALMPKQRLDRIAYR